MYRCIPGALALAGMLAAATPALAADPLDNFYGNTLIGKGSRGEWRLWYKPDHTYEGDYGGRKASGAWSIEGTKVCLNQINPSPPPDTPPRCYPVEAHNVGETWTGQDAQGATITFNLVAGQQ